MRNAVVNRVAARTRAAHRTIPVRALSTRTTHFGKAEVPWADKENLVKKVFSNVAPSYDIMNDLMSGGVHRLWKDELIRQLNPTPYTRLLDVAGGTGDIGFRFLDKAAQYSSGAVSSTGLDVDG